MTPAFPMRSARTAQVRYIRNYDAAPVPMEGGDQPWVLDVLATSARAWTHT